MRIMNIRKIVVLLIFSVTLPLAAGAKEEKKEQNQTYLDYIDKYHSIAVEEMKTYGIPASITLAQGLLESGAGKSQLAIESNNHFGIKCHDWKGDRVYFDDDEKGECFRKYTDPKDSYKDHALFLKEKPRYSSLFQLQGTDYKGWATGLKQCGYATDPNYASRLISIIEWYNLAQYDQDVKIVEPTKEDEKRKNQEAEYKLKSSMGVISMIPSHNIVKKDGKQVVIAAANDTYESIAAEFGLRKWEIRWYNKAKKGDAPSIGQEVVIKK